MRLGFIGTGKIASSVITGICTSKISFQKILISRRNKNVAQKLKMPKLALSVILIILGLYIGNYIDEKLLGQTHKWIGTSAIMFIYILVCIIFVSKYLEKFANYEKKTSFFSAAPGGLGPLVMLAEHEKSDIS